MSRKEFRFLSACVNHKCGWISNGNFAHLNPCQKYGCKMIKDAVVCSRRYREFSSCCDDYESMTRVETKWKIIKRTL